MHFDSPHFSFSRSAHSPRRVSLATLSSSQPAGAGGSSAGTPPTALPRRRELDRQESEPYMATTYADATVESNLSKTASLDDQAYQGDGKECSFSPPNLPEAPTQIRSHRVGH